MGAFSGGLTYLRYRVRDPLPEGWRDNFQAAITAHAFKDIDPASEEERALGWCSALFALDTELFPEQYLHNEYLVLALRIDTLSVPGPLLRLQAELEARRVMAEQQRDSLNRYERAEIKERVKLALRKRILPGVKAVDMVWHLDSGVLRFWTASEKLNLEFVELFESTFEMPIVPDSAYTIAAFGTAPLDEGALAKIAGLDPSLFVDADALAAAMEA